MLPLVAVSGAECVEALQQASFVVRSRSASATVLEHGARIVLVPDVAMLTPESLERVLREAGVSYEEFLDLLSESPTDPDLQRTSGIRRSRPAGQA